MNPVNAVYRGQGGVGGIHGASVASVVGALDSIAASECFVVWRHGDQPGAEKRDANVLHNAVEAVCKEGVQTGLPRRHWSACYSDRRAAWTEPGSWEEVGLDAVVVADFRQLRSAPPVEDGLCDQLVCVGSGSSDWRRILLDVCHRSWRVGVGERDQSEIHNLGNETGM